MTPLALYLFTRHLRSKGQMVAYTVVPPGWVPGEELATELWPHMPDDPRWHESFTTWRRSLRVSCLIVPTHAIGIDRGEGRKLEPVHIAA